MMTFGLGYTLTVWTENRPLQPDTATPSKRIYVDTIREYCLSDNSSFP